MDKVTFPYGAYSERDRSTDIMPRVMVGKARVPGSESTLRGMTLDSTLRAQVSPHWTSGSNWGSHLAIAAPASARGPAAGATCNRWLDVDATGGDFAVGSIHAHRDVSSSLAYRGRRSHFTDHLASTTSGAGRLRNGTFAAFTSPRMT